MKWRDIKALLKKEGITDDTELIQVHLGHGDEYPHPTVSGTEPVPQPPVLHLNSRFNMAGVKPVANGDE